MTVQSAFCKGLLLDRDREIFFLFFERRRFARQYRIRYEGLYDLGIQNNYPLNIAKQCCGSVRFGTERIRGSLYQRKYKRSKLDVVFVLSIIRSGCRWLDGLGPE